MCVQLSLTEAPNHSIYAITNTNPSILGVNETEALGTTLVPRPGTFSDWAKGAGWFNNTVMS